MHGERIKTDILVYSIRELEAMQFFYNQAFLFHTFTKPDGKSEYWFYFLISLLYLELAVTFVSLPVIKYKAYKIGSIHTSVGVSIFIAFRMTCKVVRIIFLCRKE
jgi:hypothetical protein